MSGQESLPWRKFGRYQLQELVSVTEMGMVYRAWDPWLECAVAVKLVTEDRFPDQSARQQLLEEARIALKLQDHPGICKVRTVEEDEGKAAIVMDWVDGQVLTRLIPAQVGLPIAHVIGYGIEVANAVAHAHERGVIHRDLKSGNIMVTPDGHIKLLDFGLSKIHRVERSNDIETAEFASSTESIAGTPPYCAPEVLRREPVDTRSDIWSFGVLLYEMACGRMPFTGSTIFELGSAILKDNPPGLPAHVPDELAEVIIRCLNKDPVQRYQNVTRVREALEQVEFSNTAFTLPAPARKEIAIPPSVAVLPLENQSSEGQNEYFADGLTEALITALTKLGTLRVISNTSIMPYRRRVKSVRQIARELNVDAIVEGSVFRERERVRISVELIDVNTGQLLWAENYERDLQDILALHSQIAAAIAAEVYSRLSSADAVPFPKVPEHVQVNPKAYDLYLQGRYFWNNQLIDQDFKAAEYYKKAVEVDPSAAMAHAGLANSYVRMATAEYGLVNPSEVMPKAKLSAIRAIELDESLAEAHVALAMMRYRFEGDWTGAEKEFLRAIELKDGDSAAHYAYSVFLMVSSRFDEALKEVKVAQDLNPLSPAIHFSLGLLLYLSRQFDEAVTELRETVTKFPDFPLATLVLGLTLMHKGLLDEAAAEINSAIDLAGSVPLWRGFLGQAYGMAGRKSEASKVLNELQKARLKQTPYVPPTAFALVQASLGEVDAAFSSLEKAIRERDGLLIYLKVGSVFDSLRSDNRFPRLLTRVGLQEEPQVEVRHPAGPVPAPPIPIPSPPSRRLWWSRKQVRLAAATALILLPVAFWIARSDLGKKIVPKFGQLFPPPPTSLSPSAKRVMLAVETFENFSGESNIGRLVTGLKENLFIRLSQLAPRKLGVIELETSDQNASLAEKCRHSGAAYVLGGGIERSGNSVIVTDKLMSCADYTMMVGGRHQSDLTVDSIVEIEIRLAEEIVEQILVALPKSEQPTPQVDAKAYEAFLKGRYLWAQRTPKSLDQAVRFFQKAIELDPKYAPSYAGLADCYALLGSAPNTTSPPRVVFPKAEENARKALDLDPDLAEAHVSLGHYDLVYARNYADAEKEFETAIRLRPNYATARQYYAYYLTAMGRLDEAIDERKRAVALEPASPLFNAALGEAYYEAHDFAKSIAHNQDALSLEPQYAVALINVGRSLEQQKRYPEALKIFSTILAFAPDDPAVLAFLGHGYAVSGQKAKAQAIVSRLVSMRKTRYVSSLYIALVYTGLDQTEQAFQWLNEAYDERCDYLVYLPTEPLADPLRADPRFDDLLKRLGLPKINRAPVGTIN